MEESTTTFWINKIIKDTKEQERRRIIKIIKSIPNLEMNCKILISEILKYDEVIE